MKKIYFLFCLFFITQSGLSKQRKTFMIEESHELEQKSGHLEQFFNACLDHSKGNLHKARDAYKRIIINEKSPAACTKAYIQSLFDTQDFKQVLTLTDKKYRADPAMQLLRAQSFLMLGDNQQAEPILTTLLKKKPDDVMTTYQLLVCLMRQQKNSEALKIIDSFLQEKDRSPQHAMFYFLQSKIFLMQNDPKKALESVNNALEVHPQFDQGILLKSMLLEQMGNIDEAVDMYQKYLNIATNPQAEQQLINMILRHKKYSHLPCIIEQSRNKNADFFFNLGSGLLSLQQKESSIHAFAKACDLNPEKTKAWTAQINLTKTENNPAHVEAILTKWFLKTSNYAVVVNMLMQLHGTFFSSDQMITYLQNLHATHLTTPETLGLLVDIHFEKKEYVTGLEILKKAESFPLKSTAQTSVLFNKAYGHWMLNQKNESVPLLQQALNLSPDHTESGNLLALYYLETEKNLDEAEKLINTVLEKEPHNPAFLTTKQHVMQKKQQQYANYVQAPTLKESIKKNI